MDERKGHQPLHDADHHLTGKEPVDRTGGSNERGAESTHDPMMGQEPLDLPPKPTDRTVDDPTDRGRHNVTGDTPERAYDHRTGKGFDERAGERLDRAIDRVTGEGTGERIGTQHSPQVDDFGLNRPPRKP